VGSFYSTASTVKRRTRLGIISQTEVRNEETMIYSNRESPCFESKKEGWIQREEEEVAV
jgi:hypothetical protein